MGEDDDKARALATIAPVPPLVRANDLASAPRGSMIYVDGRGQVRSWRRARVRAALTYGALAATGIGLLATSGAIGVAMVGAGAAWIAFRMRGRSVLERAAQLMAHDRVDEAVQVLDALATRRLANDLRALVEQNLAFCHTQRRDFDRALAHIREAIAWHARSENTQPHAMAAMYTEVGLLVGLGRVPEARALFRQRFPRPQDGDYLRLVHWTTELDLCFAEGAHALSPDELHDRARVALGMTSSAGFLALLAWAHHHLGDLDQAWHLLREAEERRDPHLERSAPRLHAWMLAHRDEAQAAADRDPLDAL